MINQKLKIEVESLIKAIKTLDRKVVIIFLSVAILQTISWYFTSRRFYRENIFEHFQGFSHPYLLEYFYWFIGDFFTLFILSSLIIRFILKEKISDYGFKIGDYKTGLFISLLFVLLMVLINWFISATPNFADKYPLLDSAKNSWMIFLIFESGMLIYMIAWEFIWRGFMLFGLERRFGYYSVLIQMLPFVILHNGKPFPETIGAILGGIALGVLAIRTRSVYYCIIAHIGTMYSIDLISTLRFRANDYGIGLSSLVNLVKQIF